MNILVKINILVTLIGLLRSDLAASRHLLRRTVYTKQTYQLINQVLTSTPNRTIHLRCVTYVLR